MADKNVGVLLMEILLSFPHVKWCSVLPPSSQIMHLCHTEYMNNKRIVHIIGQSRENSHIVKVLFHEILQLSPAGMLLSCLQMQTWSSLEYDNRIESK